MALNRIIDKDIDGKNPRTASRHLPTGKISELGAWALSFAFLITLLVSSLKLNPCCVQNGVVTCGVLHSVPLH